MVIRLAVAAVFVVAAASCTEGEIGQVTSVPMESQAAEVIQVLDGDSLLVRTDVGQSEVRLVGINAPERDECFGDDAREALRQLLSGRVTIATAPGADDVDQFGRLLRYVRAEGELVNSALVDSGHAVALPSSHANASLFASLEEGAFGRRLGMWAPDACGPASRAVVRILTVEANPPGDDFEREFVEIGNDGRETVDVSGWTIRDTSSVHRFTFPAGTTLESGTTVIVYTGCDTAGPGLRWCATSAVWNNSGDTVIVQDGSGNVVDRVAY